MGYRNSTLYTLKYVADMLSEDEDFLHECSIEMFPEDGRLSAYDTFPASELTEHIVLFTDDVFEVVDAIFEIGRASCRERVL